MRSYSEIIYITVHQVLRTGEVLRDIDDAIALPILNVIESYLLSICEEIQATTLQDDSDRIINIRMEAEISRFSQALYQAFPKA